MTHTYPGKGGFCFFCYWAVLCAQIIEYSVTRWLHSFVCASYYLIVIIMQTYLKVLNCYNACQVHSVICVSKIKSILLIIVHAIYGAEFIPLTHSLAWLWEQAAAQTAHWQSDLKCLNPRDATEIWKYPTNTQMLSLYASLYENEMCHISAEYWWHRIWHSKL